MSFRKPCHMPFRKLIPPFTLTAIFVPNFSAIEKDAAKDKCQHGLGEINTVFIVHLLELLLTLKSINLSLSIYFQNKE